MKAIQKTEPKPGAVYHEIPDPTITDSELLVKIGAAAFCKSDVDVYEWAPSVATANYELPFTMGHEYCGEVMEVGKSVRGFRKGDHVAGETHVPCGHCYTCRTGNPHICGNNMGIVGRSVHGSFAGYMILVFSWVPVTICSNSCQISDRLFEGILSSLRTSKKQSKTRFFR